MKRRYTLFSILLMISSLSMAQSPAGSAFYVDFDEFNVDGLVRYVNCGFGPEMNTGAELTMEVWCRIYDTGWNQKIVGRTNGSFNTGYVTAMENGKCYSEIWNPGLNEMKEGFVLPQQYWVHFAVTFEAGNQMVTYVNGIEEGTQNVSNNPIGTNSEPLIIGIAPWDLANFQSFGHIDEVRIWDVARTGDEIRSWMHRELIGSESGLVASYSFNEGSGTSVADSGPYAFDGTIANGSDNNWRESRAPIASEITAGTMDLAALWRGVSISDPRVASTDEGMTLVSDFEEGDNNYAVFGHDGGSGTSTDNLESSIPANFARSARQWSVTETDTVTCDVIIDLDEASGGGSTIATDKDAGFYTLLWRPDASSTYTPAAGGDMKTGNIITFDDVNLQNGWYAIGVGDAMYDGVGTGLVELDAEFALFPIPASDVLNARWNVGGEAIVEVLSLDGRLLSSQLANGQASIDISQLDAGQYQLLIRQGEKRSSRSFQVN